MGAGALRSLGESRCATLTNWPRIEKRFRDLPAWQDAAGPTKGWNDLDSLDIGDGEGDGDREGDDDGEGDVDGDGDGPVA